MNKIESFTIDHLKLKKGLYVSRKDRKNDFVVTTFDLRFTTPNVDQPMSISALHTIEHLFATFLRNSDKKEDIVYFGPMGCRTGCYLIMFGDLSSQSVYDLVVNACDFVINFSGNIPGASAIECGNYLDHDLYGAKEYVKAYKKALIEEKNLNYPI